MYNPQLETFLRVADAGSFNKAAEESYITPTAVIKQINLLEESLGVKLFDRSHRGLQLTKAGRIIRIGSSPMTPAQLLMDLWSRVQALHPDIKFQIVPFENTPENAREILANLGKNIDIVGGIFDETMLHLRGCAGLELTRGRFCCAVSIHHRLADKDKLQVSDLYGENLLLSISFGTICGSTTRKFTLWILIFTAWTCSTAARTPTMCCWRFPAGRMSIRF